MHTISLTKSSPLPTGAWRVDPARSQVTFAVRKLGAGMVRGRFGAFEGTVAVDAHGTAASGSVTVASLTTGNEDRDRHLCDAAFFAAAEFPIIAFRSRRTSRIDGGRWRLSGQLTIRDRTVDVSFIATAHDSPSGPCLQLVGEIDRRDFGLTWGRTIEATGVVSPTIHIELEIELLPLPPTTLTETS